MSETKSIIGTLAEVMVEVHRLPKNGYNERQDYHYVTEADVMECVRAQLAKRGVMILHDIVQCVSEWRDSKSGGNIQFTTVCLEFTAHGSDGAILPLGKGYGQGQDSGEKAVYKAITGAYKYKLLKLFLISSGDDPEASKRAPKDGTSAPARVDGPRFPNFGPRKGDPIHGAEVQHLEFYLAAARKSLADPEKAKWHAKERALIAAYEEEIARQRTTAAPAPVAASTPTTGHKPPIVDVADGESEDDARKRSAGGWYNEAVAAGALHGLPQPAVGGWLRAVRGRAGKTEVTREDLAALSGVLALPPVEVAKRLIPLAADGKAVELLLNWAGPKVTTEEFASLVAAAGVRKAALRVPPEPGSAG
jgi:hypothetical protein